MSVRDTLPCDIEGRFVNTKNGAVTTRNFSLTKVIGQGGMATVFLAIDKDHPRSLLDNEEPAYVAIKYLIECPADVDGKPPEIHSRFVRECAVLRELHHPNIIHVHDLWRDQEGQTFIEMEYVPKAQTLEEIILGYRKLIPSAGRASRSVVPMRIVLGVARQVLAGIQALHAHRIVHRDLKPGNFLLTKGAGGFRVKVMDFGIAKDLQADASGGPKITQEHSILGTPYYMSPEQVVGTGVHTPTDLWAFGVVLYELVTGELPFPATKNLLAADNSNLKAHTLEVWIKITNEEFVPPETLVDDLDPDIARIIAGCLRKEPHERMTVPEAQALLEMAEDTQREEDARADLDTLPNGSPSSVPRSVKLKASMASRKSALLPPPPSPSSFPYHYLGFAAAFGLMGVFVAWLLMRHGVETPVSSPPQAAPIAQAAPPPMPMVSRAEPAAPSPTASSKWTPGVGPPAGSPEDETFRRGLDYAKKKQCRTADRDLLGTLSRYPGFLPAIKAEAECMVLTHELTRAKTYAASYLQYEGTDVADFSPALRALVAQPAPSPR